MQKLLDTFFNVEIVLSIYPVLLGGLANTLFLSLVLFPTCFTLGLLLSIAGSSRHRGVRIATVLYIDFFRAFPPLVLLILVYYASPFLGLRPGPFLAAYIALTLNASSYYAEVHRAGLESVDRGQSEAARSTGLREVEIYFWVVLPQALRNVMSPLIGNTIELIKLTAIASVVSYSELLKVAKQMQSLLFSPTPLIAAALIYFVVLWPAVRWLSQFERSLMERD